MRSVRLRYVRIRTTRLRPVRVAAPASPWSYPAACLVRVDPLEHPAWCTGRHARDEAHGSEWVFAEKPLGSTLTIHTRFYQTSFSDDVYVQVRITGLTHGLNDVAGYGFLTGSHAYELGWFIRQQGREILDDFPRNRPSQKGPE